MSAVLILGMIAIGVIGFVVIYCWFFHCLFFWHKWDTSRIVTDVCLRCGDLRFK